MSDRFRGKIALIAGGTGGLGRAVTLAFLREGATATSPTAPTKNSRLCSSSLATQQRRCMGTVPT